MISKHLVQQVPLRRSLWGPFLSAIVALAVGTGLLLCHPGRAAALVEEPLSPARGLSLPGRTIVTNPDAMAVEENPALTGFLPTPAVGYQFVTADEDEYTTGHGIFAGGQLLPGLGMALGLQLLDSPFQQDSYRKWTVGGTLGDGYTTSLGVTYNRLSATGDSNLDDWSSWDLSLAHRLSQYASIGAVARDLRAPRGNGQNLGNTYDLGLALRPIPDWVTVAGDVRLGTQADTFKRARALLRFDLFGGLGIGAQTTFMNDGDIYASAVVDLGLPYLLVSGGAMGRVRHDNSLNNNTNNDTNIRMDGYAAGVTLSGARRPSVVPYRNVTVEVPVRGDVPDRSLPMIFAGTPDPSLPELLSIIRRANRDPDVTRILLDISTETISLSSASELRSALEESKASGKEVVAHIERTGNAGYYLATVANHIKIDPAASLNTIGLQATLAYLAGSLEKLGLGADFLSVGDYKNAPDSLTRREPSEAQLEAENSLLNHLYREFVDKSAASRGIDNDRFERIVDGGPYSAPRALAIGLVDDLSELTLVRRILERDSRRVGALDYAQEPRIQETWEGPARIALIHIDGVMVTGESANVPLTGNRVTGSSTVVRALEEAQEDDSIRAVVLRINTGGGSATAANIISTQVQLTAAHKPVVVSMGSVAASGGYWAALGASTIFATPATITGSIGIFGGKLYETSLYETLGINQVVLKRGERADMFSFHRPFQEDERQDITDLMNSIYDLFIFNVSLARSMPAKEVAERAQGRIWSGEQAHELQLVDRVGGFNDAVDEARRLAGLSPERALQLVVLPRPGFLEGVVTQIATTAYQPSRPVEQGGFVILDKPSRRTSADHRAAALAEATGLGGANGLVTRVGSAVPALDAFLAGLLHREEALALMPVKIEVK